MSCHGLPSSSKSRRDGPPSGVCTRMCSNRIVTTFVGQVDRPLGLVLGRPDDNGDPADGPDEFLPVEAQRATCAVNRESLCRSWSARAVRSCSSPMPPCASGGSIEAACRRTSLPRSPGRRSPGSTTTTPAGVCPVGVEGREGDLPGSGRVDPVTWVENQTFESVQY